MSDDLATLTALIEKPGQPETLFKAFEAATQRLVGHQLFTLLYVDGQEVARIYSNRPGEYPLSGRKTMGPTPWGKHVLEERKPYLGKDKAGIRWAFFDHELIESMGLGSVINIPAIYDGKVVGTINLLAPEHHYREEHVAPVARLAPVLVPAFLAARAAAGAA
ncbi:GAF domain-containing protein [Bosea sp. UNC402CLCol]|uniref:GAF domain-containing protein n=1 Tax=Bosea sp. UNC402CLCol TaxID=1510531 RepID=UPI00056DCCC1|nr:GAF domain-containing protein [Bosea sp. UNC402CLCol]